MRKTKTTPADLCPFEVRCETGGLAYPNPAKTREVAEIIKASLEREGHIATIHERESTLKDTP